MQMDFDDSDFDTMILEVLEDGLMLMYTIMRVCSSTCDFFNPNKLEEGGQGTIDHKCGVCHQLGSMCKLSHPFKTLVDFIIGEFDELCTLVDLVISTHTRSTWELFKFFGRPMKLSSQQQLFNFIFYMKYNKVIIYDAYVWSLVLFYTK